MARTEITDTMLRSELVLLAKYKYSMPSEVIDRLRIVIRYGLETDEKIMSIAYLPQAEASYGLEPDDLLMSLNDFSRTKLEPLFSRLAEYIGYASWD